MAKSTDEDRQNKGFVAGISERYTDTVELGQTLVREPRSFPAQLLRIVRRTVKRLWDLRGGGLYACGFVITFLYLETAMFIEDIIGFSGFGSIGEEILQYFLRFTVESLQNTVTAFIWPVYIIQISPLWGGVALGLGFWLFPVYLKKPLQAWLFPDDASAAAGQDRGKESGAS